MAARTIPVLALATERSADESFYREAAEYSLAEIELGRSRREKGKVRM
jgi:hypothetical protein